MLHRTRFQTGGKVIELQSRRTRADRDQAIALAQQELEETGTVQGALISYSDTSDHIIAYGQWINPSRELTPEQAMQLATLEGAARDLNGQRAVLRREARAWIDRNDRSHPYSFASICESLDLDPTKIRNKLLEGDTWNRSSRPLNRPRQPEPSWRQVVPASCDEVRPGPLPPN